MLFVLTSMQIKQQQQPVVNIDNGLCCYTPD